MEKLLNKQMAEFIEILESDKNLISEDVWTNHEKKEWFKLKQQELLKEALAEERERVVGNLPEIRASALSLLLNDCPNCGQVINRSFVDDLTCRIQDEYKQRVLSSLLDKLTK